MSILENNDAISDITDHQHHHQLSSFVFGRFVTTLSSLFLSGTSQLSARTKFAKNVFIYVSGMLLIVRSIWYIKMLGTSPNLSLEWARNSLQLSISLNALGALYWLQTDGKEFVTEFCTLLSKSNGRLDRVPKNSACSKFCSFAMASICMFTCFIWAFRQILQMEMHKKMINYSNSNYVEQSLYEMQFISSNFWLLSDTLLALYAGFLSALTLCLFYLSFQSVLAEWTIFKRERFDDAIGDGQIANFNVLADLANAMSPMLRFAHFTSNKMEKLGTSIFMTAVFCYISASFVTSGGGGPNNNLSSNWKLFNIVDSINNGAWSLFSIMLLINVIKSPYDVHSKIREIKEELLLTDSIWKGDPTLISLTRNTIMRIDGTRIHRIGSQLFHLVFVAQIVLVSLLVSGSNCSKQPPAATHQNIS